VRKIRVTARCRVDLAGGTLDIWPIGLLHPGAQTVNVAIEVPVRVELEPGGDRYRVRQGATRHEVARVTELASDPDTALVGLALEALGAPPCALALESASPRGAGLGASSALTVALLAALEIAREGRLEASPDPRAALARDLEARLMRLPTGRQDHFPAQLGGALALEHRPGGERVRALDLDLAALDRRLVVAYSGQSHFSAGNNWQVIRRRLEGDPEVVARLDAVRDAAAAMPEALLTGDWERVGALMADDWHARRGLSAEISTPALERLLEAGRRAGAWGGKACGAGGGGCVAVLGPPERREAIATALLEAGARVLEAPPTARGLEFTIEER
jgi:D-glycero-alpha-D-manno-heptose-7-phosphate kinase